MKVVQQSPGSCKPSLDVVLVSFNTRQLTLECLESLMREIRVLGGQVIVVDNASTDGSAAAVQAAFREVKVISADRNLGFGAANNLAFEKCTSDNVLLLNTDTIVRPGALQSMMQTLDSDPSVGAVGCRLENADGSLQKSCWSFPTPRLAWSEAFGLNRLGLTRDWHRWDHASEQDVDFVIGAALMVRRSVIEQIGGFDPRFFLYSEEADWQKRMHAAGWKVRFTPAGTIVHLGGASGEGMRDRQLVEFCRSIELYIRKHHGSAGFYIFRTGVIVGTSLRVALAWVQSVLRPGRSRAKLQQLQRTLSWWCGFGPREGFRELAETAHK
jgi:GT2 family glycosyltransferase